MSFAVEPCSRMGMLFLFLLLSMLVSCGPSGPRLVTVRGVVTYQGKPVPEAQILFSPEAKAGDRFWPANATTQSDGGYQLQTAAAGSGVVPGTYTVTISKRGPSPGPAPGSPAVGNETDPSVQAYMLPGPPLIPEKYFSPTSSPLTAEVTKSGGTIDFDLTD